MKLKKLKIIDKELLEQHKYKSTIVWDTYEIREKVNEIINFITNSNPKSIKRKE